MTYKKKKNVEAERNKRLTIVAVGRVGMKLQGAEFGRLMRRRKREKEKCNEVVEATEFRDECTSD